MTFALNIHIMPEWCSHKGVSYPWIWCWEVAGVPEVERSSEGNDAISPNLHIKWKHENMTGKINREVESERKERLGSDIDFGLCSSSHSNASMENCS